MPGITVSNYSTKYLVINRISSASDLTIPVIIGKGAPVCLLTLNCSKVSHISSSRFQQTSKAAAAAAADAYRKDGPELDARLYTGYSYIVTVMC